MYAMNGKFIVRTGKRDMLISILLRASEIVKSLPGCRMYLVGEDASDSNAVHVMELWNDQETHDASLKDEGVRALIAEAMPLMDGTPSGSSMNISGGYGMKE